MLKEANKTIVCTNTQTKHKPKTGSNILLPLGLLSLIGLAMAPVEETKPVEPKTTKLFSYELIADPIKDTGSKLDVLIEDKIITGTISFGDKGLQITSLNVNALSTTELLFQLTTFFKNIVPDEQLSSIVSQTQRTLWHLLPQKCIESLGDQDLFDIYFDTKVGNEGLYIKPNERFHFHFPCIIYTSDIDTIELIISSWTNQDWIELRTHIGSKKLAKLIQQRILAANIVQPFIFSWSAEAPYALCLTDKSDCEYKYFFSLDDKEITYMQNTKPLTLEGITELIKIHLPFNRSFQRAGINLLTKEILQQSKELLTIRKY